MSVKICGYCKNRVDAGAAQCVTFQVQRREVSVWFCSLHCVFWGGAQHTRMGFATTVKGLRQLFGAAVEVVK